MKLLFVIDHLSSGGAQRQMTLLACGLAQRGIPVDVFMYRSGDFFVEQLQQAGVRVIRGSRGSKWGRVLAIYRLINSGEYRLVLSYLLAPNLYCIAARAMSRHKPKLIVSERTCPKNPNYGLSNEFVERSYRFADAIVTNSFHMAEFLVEKYPTMKSRVHAVWNGVDLGLFQAAEHYERRERLRFVAVGQLGRFKEPHTVIRGLGILLHQHGLDAEVTWFARRYPDLHEHEQEYLDELNEQIRTEGVEHAWTWREETSELQRHLPEYDASIHASTVEGLPNAICESLASGLPVFASRTLDHPRLVGHGDRGFLFEPGECGRTGGLHGTVFQAGHFADCRNATEGTTVCRRKPGCENFCRSLRIPDGTRAGGETVDPLRRLALSTTRVMAG